MDAILEGGLRTAAITSRKRGRRRGRARAHYVAARVMTALVHTFKSAGRRPSAASSASSSLNFSVVLLSSEEDTQGLPEGTTTTAQGRREGGNRGEPTLTNRWLAFTCHVSN